MKAKDSNQVLFSKRFRDAYGRFGENHRRAAKRQFCAIHGVTERTFSNKLAGSNPLAQAEVEWMESYNPYAQPQTA